MSVFSNYLLWRVNFERHDHLNIEELGKALQTYNRPIPQLFLFGGGYLRDSDTYIEQDDVQDVLWWVCKNIICQLNIDNHITRDVKIRIATGMLNKTNIPQHVNIYYHDNMIRNIYDLIANIQGLPF